MKKKFPAAGAALIALMLAGCGQDNGDTAAETDTEDVEIVPISVDLTVPGTGTAGEPVALKAAVTQGEEKVSDADEVVYEIWEEGKKDDSRMVEAEQTGDGVYEAETEFDADGLYHVQVHVTARDMHTMPMKDITIGEGAAVDEGHASAHGEGHEHHHTAPGFSMHFMEPDHAAAGTPAAMMVHLQQDNQPLEHARVRLEIIENGKTDAAQWVKLEEGKAGEYAGDVTFDAAGKAEITVHVEDDSGLHEHETHELDVQAP
ncbi:FixH family protein [Sporosarcina trichiuri]|uniref:FixH family protein n=1 Tax=Sporosarcina trichiuri TaxID=3056445 RepID=UPI0025B34DDF|nr:FixH family protein [Sporosarcina sp. 0.2-SM1T-5]WJY27900.1 FixH family protein [Sporosarcina sp. 0.2-SM1T-5]